MISPPDADLALTPQNEKTADALARYYEGIVAEDQEGIDRALPSYLAVLDHDPGFVELAIKVAFEFVRQNDPTRAIEVLKDALKENPKSALIRLNLSTVYARHLGKVDSAIRYAREALALEPENPMVHQMLYELYLAGGQVDAAEAMLDRAAKHLADDPEFHLRLAGLYARLYFREGAKPTKADLEKVANLCRRAAELGKDDPAVLNRVADFFVQIRDVPSAIPLYVRILEQRDAAPDALIENVQGKLAESLLATEQREEAVRVLEELLASNPASAAAYELLAQIYEQSDQLPKAIDRYRQLLLLAPSEPSIHLRVADLQLRTDQPLQALETMREARRRFPGNPHVAYSFALAASAAKMHAESLAAFEETLQEAKLRAPDLPGAVFYFQYGSAAEQAGLHEKAVDLLRKAIALDPALAPALNYLGYMWAERGENLPEAESLIRRALELDPENPAYLDSIGWVYFKLGKYAEARDQLLQAAARLEEGDPVVFDHLGDTLLRLGNPAEAVVWWDRALQLDPENNAIRKKAEQTRQLLANP